MNSSALFHRNYTAALYFRQPVLLTHIQTEPCTRNQRIMVYRRRLIVGRHAIALIYSIILLSSCKIVSFFKRIPKKCCLFCNIGYLSTIFGKTKETKPISFFMFSSLSRFSKLRRNLYHFSDQNCSIGFLSRRLRLS